MRASRHVSKEEIADGLRNLGIGPGDAVFLHASLRSLGFVPGGATTVIEALREVLTPDGVLIVPTYHMPAGTIHATCLLPDYEFDPRIHGTELGALPSAFLKMDGVERSIHPTHSVSASGRRAREITGAHHLSPSIFGPGSPWEKCIELGGKVLGLGVTMGPVTFYHTLEDRMGEAFPVPVRMETVYRLPCRTMSGERVEVPVHPLNPDYAPRRIDAGGRDDLRDYFWREFSRAGLLHVGAVGEAKAWYICAREFIAHLEKLALEGITIYATPEQLARRPIP